MRDPPKVRVLLALFTPVPPLVGASVPAHPAVMEVAWNRAVLGDPPKVKVMLVSFTSVKGAPITEANCHVAVVGDVAVRT